jgi:hypothetical protein
VQETWGNNHMKTRQMEREYNKQYSLLIHGVTSSTRAQGSK